LYASVGAALITAREDAADPYRAIEAILPWAAFVNSVAGRGSASATAERG
jgi:hypothetical protein